MSTYKTYTGDGTTTRFPITFDYARPTDVYAYVANVSVLFFIEGTDAVIEPAPAGGAEVLLKRDTDIANPLVSFRNSGGLYAEQVNAAFDQCRFAIEELQVTIDGTGVVPSGGGGGGTSNVPNPTAATQFISSDPSGGGFVWAIKSKAQMQTLLEINPSGTTDTRLPTPGTANTFLIVNPAGTAYQLATVSTVQALLGVPTLTLPALNNRANHFLVTDGSGGSYILSDPAGVRSTLQLGTAAQTNVGTAVGNTVQLVSSGSGPALPAVFGGHLTGLAKAQDFCMYERASAVTVAASGGYGTASTSLASIVPSATTFETVAASGITVPTGTYRVKVEYDVVSGSFADVRVACTGGTVVAPTTVSRFPGGDQHIETVFRVTSGPTTIVVEADASSTPATSSIRIRLSITKVA
jgi:hypothetical protein